MLDEPLGFYAKAPLSAWNQRLGVDYPGAFKALLKAALAAATANAPGAISAAIDGLFAFRAEDAKRPPEELAWLLTRRTLARAMAELTVEAARRHGMLLQDKEGLISYLDRTLDGTEIWIDPAFFDRPAEHPIVDAVKPQFHEWLVSLGLNSAEATSVNHRLGAYFTFALRREWAEHAEYAPLEAEFQKYENRFAKADARERAWIRNADYLQRLIREPVFDEAFGLEQIYVPLRAWYQDWPRKSSRRRRIPDEGEGEEARRVVVDLEKYLDEWLKKRDKKDPLRVICGGPGSGKTSSTKIWAAKLALAGHYVLYVPLHYLDIRGDAPDIQAILREYLFDLNVLPFDPLDTKEGERRLLILFDGLDELVMQGRAGQEVARSFVEAVANKIDRINERDDRFVQVVLEGRDIVVEAARIADSKLLHVLPYHGIGAHRFADPDNLLRKEDFSCARWWRQSGQASGAGYKAVPKPLQNDEIAEIIAQPLLNYLLALSYRRGKLDFRTAPNLNLIYRDLLDAVYERPWGPAVHPTQKVLSRDEFDQLLDELGLTAWHGDGRTFTESQAERACIDAGLAEQLTRFKEGARTGAISLLAAFYFRQAGQIAGGERTFEFTHKSFGEYFVARRIVRWIEDIHEERVRNRSNRLRGWSEEEALIKWIEVTGPAMLDSDLLVFLRREVALRRREVVEGWQRTLAELFSYQLRQSLPMHKVGLPTYREMTQQARNAEEALLVAHFCCGSTSGKASIIEWPSKETFKALLGRLNFSVSSAVARLCLGWLDRREFPTYEHPLLFDRATMSGHDLRWAFFREADLGGANLSGANIVAANLVGANLRETDLSYTHLYNARFDGADLSRANLVGAELSGANLIAAEGLDKVRGLKKVKSWAGVRIERKWVDRLGLDAEKLGLEVVDDLEKDDLEEEESRADTESR